MSIHFRAHGFCFTNLAVLFCRSIINGTRDIINYYAGGCHDPLDHGTQVISFKLHARTNSIFPDFVRKCFPIDFGDLRTGSRMRETLLMT